MCVSLLKKYLKWDTRAKQQNLLVTKNNTSFLVFVVPFFIFTEK